MMTKEAAQGAAREATLPTVSLAPMAGVTDWPFRLLCARQGARFVYTEMISAAGMAQSKRQLADTLRVFVVHPDEAPVVAQIFGHNAMDMARAAALLTETGRFVGIDVNMGCPARKVVTSGSGSALLLQPKLAEDILRAVCIATPLPVTVKLRLGWDGDSICAPDIARRAEDAGVAGVTVHGRTREMQYSGTCDLEQIARVVSAVRVPVTGNGDVRCGEDAVRMLRETGCAGIMVGRGALGNPFIFRNIDRTLRGLPAEPPTAQEIACTALQQADYFSQYMGERANIEMRKHFAWYLTGIRGAAQARAAIFRAATLEEAKDIFQRSVQPDGQA